MKFLKKFIDANHLFLVNFISISGVLGSLYFSEVQELAPCQLCWYARILFYPIAIISTVALISKDSKAYRYILSLSIPGTLLTTYHYSLQKLTFIQEAANTCGVGSNSCSSIDWERLGFVTIPLLGLMGFLSIAVICGLKLYFDRKHNDIS